MIIGNVTVDLQNPFTLAGVVGIASAIVLGVGVKKVSVKVKNIHSIIALSKGCPHSRSP